MCGKSVYGPVDGLRAHREAFPDKKAPAGQDRRSPPNLPRPRLARRREGILAGTYKPFPRPTFRGRVVSTCAWLSSAWPLRSVGLPAADIRPMAETMPGVEYVD